MNLAMKFSIIWKNLRNFKFYSNKFRKTNEEMKAYYAECCSAALGKTGLCRVSCQVLCRVPRSGTRQTLSLPSARSRHSAKSAVAECPDTTLGIVTFCRVSCQGTRQSGLFEFVFRNLFEYYSNFHKFLQIMKDFIADFTQQFLLML